MAPPLDPIAPLRAALRGHYDIEREIGQGAFATVYLARDLKHERKVALKVLHADPTSETGELRFIREIRLLARLQHPNILSLHDSGHFEALLYYVMPYVSGETLRDRINRERQLPPGVACNIARDIADALAYAHGQGIIHRDIKPENILLSAGHPMLADFGIARVIDLAGVRQLTRTGMGSPGTPAYMSPEQLLGDKELDGRSDTYSLGCVLFEMLTGKPPFAGKDGFVRRFTEPAPNVTSLRRDLPTRFDPIVSTALARSPNDRYQTARELATALTAADTTFGDSHAGEHLPAQPTHHSAQSGPQGGRPERFDSEEVRLAPLVARGEGIGKHVSFSGDGTRTPWFARVRKHRTSVALGAGVLLIAAVAMGRNKIPSLRNSLFAADVDSTRIAVLPFAGNASQRERERIANGLYASLSEWRGLRLASDQDVVEAVRADGPPTSTRAAAALARSLGAGRFIWGQVSVDEPLQARAQLYDVSSNVALKSIRFRETGDTGGFGRAANELLKLPDLPEAADGGDGKTTSYSAWNAYGRGHVAFSNGDFGSAETNFRGAVTMDPGFGPARVWLAQTLSWRAPDSRGDWREQITQALGAPSGLSQRDRIIGVALSRLADRRYPEACASYSQLTRADSLDFIGQYGLGQCQAFDSLVVRTSSSPSGWRFRSRYSDAASAYMRALRVNPSAHSILSFGQMQELLPIAPLKTRRGRSLDGQEFAAFPALIHDTVVFVPYPLIEFDKLPANQTAVARDAALEQNRTLLLDFATDWARQSPGNAGAFQAMAEVLEARAEITRSRSGGLSALDAVRKAREVAATPREKQLAATKEAWLRFKQGNFAQARLLADSVLAIAYHPLPEDAGEVIGLAALTGKLGRTAELARQTNDYAASAASLPVQVMDAAASFFAFAALGVCSDTTLALERRLDDQLAHYVAEDRLPRVRVAVKARPLSMLAPCTSGKSSLGIDAAGYWLLKLQQAFATHDTRSLRILLQSVANDSKTQRPGDVSLDVTYQLAWLRSAMGDTAAAVRQLDRALGALPSLSASSLREAGSAAAAGRAMALRVELATARGDVEDQKKWAGALADLWATADAPLQPVVTKMRALVAPAFQK
jgi:serine/threonine protein kinase/tetratricopeptide (TPR) repeat protein